MTLSAAIYTRISDDPLLTRLGVQRQEQDCRELVERKGWRVVAVYEDNDVSAYSGRARRNYRRMLADIASGLVTAIVAWDPDRLHRSPLELEEFIDLVNDHGVAIATVNSGEYDLSHADGRLTARIRGSVARHESEKKSERVKRKHLELATNGKNAGGGRPFGYESDRCTVRPAEAELVREAARRVLEGESMRSVCRDWQQRAIPTASGAPGWSAQVLRRLLVSARISGRRDYAGRTGRKRVDIGRITCDQAEWPAIISAQDSDRLRSLLGNRHRQSTGRNAYLLTGGIARCGRCGEPLQAHPRSDGRKEMACVARPGKSACGRLGILAAPVDELVAEAIFQAVDGGALRRALAERGEDSALSDSIVTLEDRLVDAGRQWALGKIQRMEWGAIREAIDSQLSDARRQLDATRREYELDGLPSDLRTAWPGLPQHRRKAAIKALVDAVIVFPARQLGRYDPERVEILWKA